MKKVNKENKFLLWELSKPGRVESSYLFGTIHLPDKTLYHRIDQVKDLLDRCDMFMAEYNLDEGQGNIESSFYLENDKELKDYFSAKKYEKIKKQFAKSFSVNLDSLSKLKPMLIENVIASSLIEESTSLPMDIYLWQYAKSLGKELHGAESLKSQLDIMNSFSLEKQLSNLVSISRNPRNFRRNIQKIIGYYLQEDLSGLYKSSISSLGKMKSILVYERNIRMADSIDRIGAKGNLMCAVGAGHLYGYKGLLRLLKHNGYVLKPIKG